MTNLRSLFQASLGAKLIAIMTASVLLPAAAMALSLSLVPAPSTLHLVAMGLALLLASAAALSWAAMRFVLRPINRLERHMGVVRRSGHSAPFVDMSRDDEIGRLVGSFNAMLAQLKDLRERVEGQSFKLGQSEQAIAVMHNVRNALNPISTVLSQGVPNSALTDRSLLNRTIAELADGSLPAVRREKLAAFLAAAIESEAQAHEKRQARLEICRDALNNVLEIIGQQQADAQARPALVPCDVTEIVARNATIARYSGTASLAFHFPSKPHWVMANRVLLSQVVGNLFANAAEAIAASGRGGGSIAVLIHERGGMIEVVVRDDGEGFDPAMAPRLFHRGFSTRAHKSGGLGLHWCANTMQSMGGALALRSDGRGHGTRAILSLQAAAILPIEAAA
ncbi:sensor histidine kinase [Sphingomonas turrisvirgatae]|uniref:sensor histidine kinase n=1 Tax=Sphingomonas turrisvirgatae TaxID=1888892 RepID=UPI001F4D56CC|nr:sensor histidine kinase [Sphingomonas turrisvirgatae]